MKNMILLFITISLFGCSKSENNTVSNNDPIIGKWKRTKEVYYNSSNVIITEKIADECQSVSSNEFKTDYSVVPISYIKISTGGCTLEPINFEYSKWENLGNNNYKLTSKQVGQLERSSIVNYEFQNSNVLIQKSNSGGLVNGLTYSYSKEYFFKSN